LIQKLSNIISFNAKLIIYNTVGDYEIVEDKHSFQISFICNQITLDCEKVSQEEITHKGMDRYRKLK